MKNVKLQGNNNFHNVIIGSMQIWFSYETPIAFYIPSTGYVVRENDWGTATGKHINAVDGGDKKNRVSGQTFELMLTEAISTFQLV